MFLPLISDIPALAKVKLIADMAVMNTEAGGGKTNMIGHAMLTMNNMIPSGSSFLIEESKV